MRRRAKYSSSRATWEAEGSDGRDDDAEIEEEDETYGEEGTDPDRRIGRLPARLLPLDFLDRW